MKNMDVKLVTDKDFLNLWRDQPGVLIRAGSNQAINPDVEKFQGKKIGCSNACKLYSPLDLIIWIDAFSLPENKPFWDALSAHDCLKMSVACDPPASLDMRENDVCWLRAVPPEKFSSSFDSGFYPCDLNGYLGFNVALLLGCNPLWLVGFNVWEDAYINKVGHFEMAKEWVWQQNRKVYVAEKDNHLAHRGLFEYKPLPTGKEEKTEVIENALGE